MNRYEGKPFLRFIDCFVLDVIDQLDISQRQGIELMHPTLAKALGRSGTWQEMVSAEMDFPESLSGQIKEIWKNYLNQAKQQGVSVSPEEFVVQFVDQNFPDIVNK
ncbi:hypothetical protein J2W28_000631 [Variovorax boronicumulans]|uniref:hypothetical protein n=1 Tax=Variovorax boronicumulans TaxID=436515 RepID=UPI002785D163|nr:hypothetical protein [Variovorax boronicumulans]MDP9989989.1 hypothetical protein [Variovorax boronicumulans]MDQ0001503.1 hypothetical protein [Variovorax boronicumulans]